MYESRLFHRHPNVDQPLLHAIVPVVDVFHKIVSLLSGLRGPSQETGEHFLHVPIPIATRSEERQYVALSFPCQKEILRLKPFTRSNSTLRIATWVETSVNTIWDQSPQGAFCDGSICKPGRIPNHQFCILLVFIVNYTSLMRAQTILLITAMVFELDCRLATYELTPHLFVMVALMRGTIWRESAYNVSRHSARFCFRLWNISILGRLIHRWSLSHERH